MSGRIMREREDVIRMIISNIMSNQNKFERRRGGEEEWTLDMLYIVTYQINVYYCKVQ